MTSPTHSHSRRNPLTNEWVLVSPHRLQRPWQGQIDDAPVAPTEAYEPDCYLCPGNTRANDQRNPDYQGPFVFDNDFPALSAESHVDESSPLFTARAETGICRVVCYTEKHHLRLATLSNKDRTSALQCLVEQFANLDQREDIDYVQIFENRGQMMGCSNDHPHAQIWALSSVPTEPAKIARNQDDYRQQHRSILLLDYANAEIEDTHRIVCRNGQWLVVVPYWAVWPYQMLIVPLRPIAAPDQLSDTEIASLSEVLGVALGSYEALFAAPAPYSLGFHPRPSDDTSYPGWQFHIHIYPPLLRSATVRKHLVGFEMLAQPQRDLTPEQAAEQLRKHLTHE
ncbi:MAG: galactose-1-phosphate uridylyltransferase [Pseudomonadota bacterium]